MQQEKMSLKEMVVSSYRELKNLRSLTGIAMLLALSVVLSAFSIQLTDSIKIGVGFIVTALLGMMYGPVAGGLAAGAGDLIKYILKPTGPYFFGFTLTAILGGVIYGLFFYKKKCTIVRAIAAKSTVTLLLNCLLNTFWVSLLYHNPFQVVLLGRVVKNVTLLPFEVIFLYVALNAATNLVIRRFAHGE
jgi:ECF transporter S component (folate family)